MIRYLKEINIILILILIAVFPLSANGKVITLINEFSIDIKTAEKGITLKSADNIFQIGFRPKILSKESKIIISQLDKSLYEFPEEWLSTGDVYSYEIATANALNGKVQVVFKLSEPLAEYKKIFIFENEKWRELNSQTVDQTTARISLASASVRLALLRHKDILEFGHASWYKYKNCLCAASPDFPKGAKLKVQNLNNGKEVVITVNDYGPVRSLFPKRVIDLDKMAFKRLGALGIGVLKNIRVTKIN